SLRLTGDVVQAATLDRQTREGRRRVLGNKHGDTLGSVESYGIDLRELGDLDGSRNALELAYRTVVEGLGDDHYRAIQSGRSYAITLRRLDDRRPAGEIMDRVVASAEAVLGHRHPLTLACLMEQACLWWADGNPADALAIADKTHDNYLELHGTHHPFTL